MGEGSSRNSEARTLDPQSRAPNSAEHCYGCAMAAPAILLTDVKEELIGSPWHGSQGSLNRLFFPCMGIITVPDQREELLAGEGVHSHEESPVV